MGSSRSPPFPEPPVSFEYTPLVWAIHSLAPSLSTFAITCISSIYNRQKKKKKKIISAIKIINKRISSHHDVNFSFFFGFHVRCIKSWTRHHTTRKLSASPMHVTVSMHLHCVLRSSNKPRPCGRNYHIDLVWTYSSSFQVSPSSLPLSYVSRYASSSSSSSCFWKNEKARVHLGKRSQDEEWVLLQSQHMSGSNDGWKQKRNYIMPKVT